jgi:hypothetical protein
VRIIACVDDPGVIQATLDHLKVKEETRELFPLPENWASPGALFG